jgi:general L-amino acid transport system substrate-binding protein
MKNTMIGIIGAAAFGVMASAASAATLDDVKAKGFIQCGVNTALAGFSAPDDKGEWTGLDVDFCRRVRRRHQGEVHAAERQGPLHRAAVG